MNQFEKLIQECDQEIKLGRPREAAKHLRRLNAGRVPNEWRLPLARVCRRAGLYPVGLRLLSKLIFPRRGVEVTASPQEMAEYAVLLLRSGASAEAIQRLSEIDASQVPEALLYRAYCHLSQWECFEAIVQLEHYLKLPLAPAARLLGQTNLAIAYVESRQHERATLQIRENLELAKTQKHLHLELYHHALLSQVYLQEGTFSKARTEIDLAQPSKDASVSHDQLFVSKLRYILDAMESKDVGPLNQLRELAVERNDWIAFREADLFSLKIRFDLPKFLHLIFGSPLVGFRNNLRLEFDCIPDRATYVLGSKTAPRFDLRSGEIDGISSIKSGGEIHQLIDILLRDFYQPLRIAEIHAALFPTEHFNVNSSPGRIHQVINRGRRWISKSNIPIEIREKDGFYSLVITGNFSFRVPLDRQSMDSWEIRLDQLRKAFGGESFSSQQAADQLHLSTMTTHRLLARAVESGALERTSRSRGAFVYRFGAAIAAVKVGNG